MDRIGHIETDRGETQFVLIGEVRDMFGLDKHSRKILDRFL